MTGKLLASLCKQKTYERNTKTVSKLTQNTESVSNNYPNMVIVSICPQGGVPRPYRASRAMRAVARCGVPCVNSPTGASIRCAISRIPFAC